MDTQEINQEKVEAFAGRMIGALNEGAIAVMTSIGHRTGLFDAMSRAALLDERGDRQRGEPERTLRARVARRDGRRRDRGARP